MYQYDKIKNTFKKSRKYFKNTIVEIKNTG